MVTTGDSTSAPKMVRIPCTPVSNVPRPCPTCGTCPTCGLGGRRAVYPDWTYRPHTGPYYQTGTAVQVSNCC